uniref:Uncharacterized protein n=1 Tax=Rhipicephalus zambeziensis TaxID=60191 RepID=A0A224YHE3_9ACAR
MQYQSFLFLLSYVKKVHLKGEALTVTAMYQATKLGKACSFIGPHIVYCSNRHLLIEIKHSIMCAEPTTINILFDRSEQTI